MNVTINGQTQTLATPITVTELLNAQGYADKLVAVAINGAFVPKSTHAHTQINANDQIEIVAPMQGG